MESVYKRIDTIKFSLLSPQQIKKMAHAKVVTAELYDKEGYPVDGGLMDIRLGVIDPGLRCRTCSGKLKECLGHFGYIELARPVVHIKFAKILHMLLQTTCSECSRILLSDDDILNEDGMRYHNEFVKHKILDIVGDLFLLGGNVIGHYEGFKTGHMLNDQLLSAILSQPQAFSIETYEELESPIHYYSEDWHNEL